jgi:hypothetical protein
MALARSAGGGSVRCGRFGCLLVTARPVDPEVQRIGLMIAWQLAALYATLVVIGVGGLWLLISTIRGRG